MNNLMQNRNQKIFLSLYLQLASKKEALMFTLMRRTYMYVQPYGTSRTSFFHDSS